MTQQKELEQALREATTADLEAIRRNPTLAAPFLRDIDEEVLDDLISSKQQIVQLDKDLEEARQRNTGISYEENVKQVEAACAEAAVVRKQASNDINAVWRGSHDEDDARLAEQQILDDVKEDVDDILLDSPLAEEMILQRLEELEERQDSLIKQAVGTKH
ncbi:hypothetical protein [Stutzerimonas stutzeri]|uniref:hypothetical protein n=1 Tax=Stutzerimonas stutzeri TaxID=316 RepID=UPI001BD15398|nr:hypothetical protein [Stutzerimonas stutzeri]